MGRALKMVVIAVGLAFFAIHGVVGHAYDGDSTAAHHHAQDASCPIHSGSGDVAPHIPDPVPVELIASRVVVLPDFVPPATFLWASASPRAPPLAS